MVICLRVILLKESFYLFYLFMVQLLVRLSLLNKFRFQLGIISGLIQCRSTIWGFPFVSKDYTLFHYGSFCKELWAG